MTAADLRTLAVRIHRARALERLSRVDGTARDEVK